MLNMSAILRVFESSLDFEFTNLVISKKNNI